MYKLGKKFGNAHLTRREGQCAERFISGCSVKQTSAAFGLSSRTVQYYLNNMKSKLGCSSKIELVAMLLESEFKAHADRLRIAFELKQQEKQALLSSNNNDNVLTLEEMHPK